MKVVKWYNNRDIRIEEMPRPKPGPRELLLKVIACGICGSDIVEWYRLPRAPLVPGHEIGGEVVEAGAFVEKYKPGDRVFVAPKVPCMSCHYCKKEHYSVCSTVTDRMPGGLAEFVLIPEALVLSGTYLLPDGITHDQSTFIEPLACVVRAQRFAELQTGDTVLVMGCGMSGLLHIKLAKALGCRVVATDVNHARLAFARNFGADITFDAARNVPEQLAAQNSKMADVVMLCTASMAAVEQSWQCVDKGGHIVFFAVPAPDQQVTIPINDFWMKEIKIITSYYCGPSDIKKALHLLEKGAVNVDDMVTHVLPLSDVLNGFRLVAAGDKSIKVIVKPHWKPL